MTVTEDKSLGGPAVSRGRSEPDPAREPRGLPVDAVALEPVLGEQPDGGGLGWCNSRGSPENQN